MSAVSIAPLEGQPYTATALFPVTGGEPRIVAFKSSGLNAAMLALAGYMVEGAAQGRLYVFDKPVVRYDAGGFFG